MDNMENISYSKQMIAGEGEGTLEFFIATTNEEQTEIKEMAIVFVDKGRQLQYDCDLSLEEIDSLRDYLYFCKKYIVQRNERARKAQQGDRQNSN